jgi:hypothetical protein
MQNLETMVAKRIAGDSMRDLPKYVYPRGRYGYLYFIRNGGCVRMTEPVGSPEFEADYQAALAAYPRRRSRPLSQQKRSEPKAVLGLPDASTLHEMLQYAPDGSLHYRERGPHLFKESDRFSPQGLANMWNGKMAGERADKLRSDGRYRVVLIQAQQYLAHRVIWKMVYGGDPDLIDHINGDGQDNRIENLRSVDAFANHRNRKRTASSTTRRIGVTFRKRNNKWQAKAAGIFLGLFDTFEDAVAAREEAERQLGFHPNHGRTA